MNQVRKYYQSLSPLSPRSLFVRELMSKTGRDRATITRWVSGKGLPQSKLERELLEEMTGLKLNNNE